MSASPTTNATDISMRDAADLINDVTVTIAQIMNEIGADGRLRLAQLLGSDSIRFNQLMIFLPELGSELIRWGHERVSSKDKRTLALRDRLLRAMTYVKHFERRFLYFLSAGFLAVNWWKVAAGFAMIGASIACLFLLGGSEATAIAIDVAMFTSAGVGVSLMGNGLRLLRNALQSKDSLEHLAPTLRNLCDAFEIIREHVSVGIQAVSEEDWEAAICAGKGIVTHTSSVPDIDPIKGWWDLITFRTVLLEDLLTN